MIERVLRNFNAQIDGRSFAGKVEEVEPPKMTLKTEEYRAGGMDAPIELDQGMEKVEMSITLAGYDPNVIGLYGLAPGNLKQFVLRGALTSEDGTVSSKVITCTGKIKSVEPGTWKPGEKSTLKIGVACHYYKDTQDGAILHEIDIENMTRVVNGVDQLAAIRSAMGL